MNKYVFRTILLLWTISCFSCEPSSSEVKGALAAQVASPSGGMKKTQAILRTQPFDFDPTDKNKVTGDYLAQTKITVPKNLASQNKWMLFEGPVLENDLVAYRYYADSRHRFDIYGKTVADLVMDTVGWQYHDIMDWGADILKVGNSLGIGSPAIWYQDTLFTFSDWERKTIEIIKESNSSSTIRTSFDQLSIAGHTFDLVQDWSIAKGQPWSAIHLKVRNGQLPVGMHFATGIVKHLPEIIQGQTAQFFYAMNWGPQSFHQEEMGMAILVEKKYQPEHIADDLSHAYAFKNANEEVHYRFLSAWERDHNQVKNANGFKQLVEQAGQ